MDEPTAVFRTPTTRTPPRAPQAADSASLTDAEGAADAESSADAAQGDTATDKPSGPELSDAKPSDDEPSDAAESGSGSGSGNRELRDAVAAWVSAEDAEEAEASDAAGASDPDRSTDGEAEPDAPKASEAAPAAKAEAKADDAASTTDAAGHADLDSDAEAATAASSAETPEADQADEADGDARPAVAVDQPTAVFRTQPPKSDRPTDADPDDKAPDDKADGEDPKGEGQAAKARTAEADAEKDAGGTDAPSSPTPKPDAASGVAADAGDGDADDAPPAVERTSQFVPLRSADDVRSAKPAVPPPGPPVKPAPADAGTPDAKAAGAATSDGDQAAGALPEVERTRQQPLPPGPGERPLDLLAQLTNKPAPPETPIRTLVRRVKIWTPLLLLLVIVFVAAQLLRPLPEPSLDLTAQSSHTFDGGKPDVAWPGSGQAAMEIDGLGSLGTSGEQKPVPIASVAKAMTAYLMLREHPMKAGEDGASIPVDKQAEEDAGLSQQGESTVDVKEGETLTEAEALNALMIASANNVARLVARWDSGSEKAFVEKMNKTAEELGMKNTTYTDPSGLLKETVSTAADQVKLGKAAMKLDAFRASVAQPSYDDRNGRNQSNWNQLVPYNGTIGIKTGTTTAAGGNLLFAAEKEVGGTKQLIIGAVLSQPPAGPGNSILEGALSAGRNLISSAGELLTAETIVKKGDVVGQVDDGLGGRTPVVATKDVTAVGWSGLEVELALTSGDETIPGEAASGTRVGTLTVGAGPGQVKVPVALAADLTEPGTGARITRIL
ncbi:D-alanyl-D-alanine carboxypeptidase [Streptomyces sp. 549]|uniref:D-alanyl-D-alanine carboxypeptidase family protein n=1 Tax=Streptomyces sp. 549 TaxID=3049076 RepID=UPI0024C34EF0|nr:D-alanyl-D-alanine carboxypeptidase [Streptomyces sp. 549]MDK1472592.1 D-alanyl-D-alanine carboxypeptidase [Streptomyces sp. 549]